MAAASPAPMRLILCPEPAVELALLGRYRGEDGHDVHTGGSWRRPVSLREDISCAAARGDALDDRVDGATERP